MVKKREEVYYDAQGNPVQVKKKRNPLLIGCIGLLLLLIIPTACGALFSNTDNKEKDSTTTEVADKETEEVTEDDTEGSETTTEEAVTEETEAPTTEAVTTEESTTEAKEPTNKDEVSREFKAALNAAQNYVDIMPFSKAGLYDQLTSEAGNSFPAEAAQYAIDNVDVDYKKEAVEAANSYNETFPMSDQELLNQLTSEAGSKFTQEEAQYALQHMDK